MNVSRMMRSFIVLLAATSLVECSGGGASHSIPTSGVTSAHRAHAMGLGTISGCGEYPDGSVAVWDQRNHELVFFEGPITSTSTATATISLPNGSSTQVQGMTFDPSGDLWVVDSQSAAIYEYVAPLTSGESPSITITGSNTGLEAPTGISYNSTTGNIYVADESADTLDVWSATASGNVAPSTTITGVSGNEGVKTDANYIYVSGSSVINVYNITASGSASPASTISASVSSFDFDVARNLYAGNTGPGNLSVWVPLGGYATSHAQNVSSTPDEVAVDDAGYIYGAPSDNHLYVINPVNWESNSGSIDVTLSIGDAEVQRIALYSPGKFNGTEPQ